MNILKRKLSTKSASGVQIKKEKMLITLNWLLEFHFTSTENVQMLLGVRQRSAYLFLETLERDGYIVKFNNKVIGDHIKLISLTQLGVNFLIENKLAYSDQKYVHHSKYIKNQTAMHHLNLQKHLISNIDKYNEIYWEASLQYEKNDIKPDCVVILKSNGNKIAIEYERWAKTNARIFTNFYRHLQNMKKKYYVGVVYLFDDINDENHYRELFNTPEWDRYKYRDRDSKPVKMLQKFNRASVPGLENVFAFKQRYQ